MPRYKTQYRLSWLDEDGAELIQETVLGPYDSIDEAKEALRLELVWDSIVLGPMITLDKERAAFNAFPTATDRDAAVSDEHHPQIIQWNEFVE